MKRLFFLIIFLSLSYPVNIYSCDGVCGESNPASHCTSSSAPDNGLIMGSWSNMGSGSYGSAGYMCSGYYIAPNSSVYYTGCVCAVGPGPGSPYQHDPYEGGVGIPGSPADPENGGPPANCECHIERVCYNASNQAVYYEIDCGGLLYVYGDISLSVRCFRTNPTGTGPPLGPGGVPPLIKDPDLGWDMPQVYSGPPGDYDQPDSGELPDTDGDGIPDYADLKPNGLADGSDNPRWRETGYTNDADGNKIGGTYKIEGKDGEYRWGAESASYDPVTGSGDHIKIGGSWQSPESFADNSSGGGWSGGGGGGATSVGGSYDPYAMPVDPQNPTPEEIAEWEASEPPPPIDFGEAKQPDSDYETGSGSSGDSSTVIDADLREVSKILSGIEQDQKGYGAANINELKKITELLEKNIAVSDPDRSNDPSTKGGYYCHWTTYYDNGVACGWLLKTVKDPDVGGYTEYMIGQTSADSEPACCVWEPASDMWNSSNPWSSGGGNQGWVNDGSGSGSGSGLTGDDVAVALAGDRALGDADAESERLTQTPGIEGANPDFQGYVEADIPLYTDEETAVDNKVNTLMTNSDLSGIRDSLGISTVGSTSSLSCNLYGSTMVFDFAKYESIYNILGGFILSLSYLFGFFLILRG